MGRPSIRAAWGKKPLKQGGVVMQFRHILAPTDFSEYSKQAVESALEWAKKFGAKLSILHVIELPAYPAWNPYPIEGYVPPNLTATFLEDLEHRASQELAQVVPKAESAGVEVARLVAVGSPYRKIIDMAEAEQVDLIVMATAGRTGFSRLVMGSTAERVVRTASCPVLTIRPQE
jgi:nucleotide-binding universal stress UspA family protein